jgi:hypothetical protein
MDRTTTDAPAARLTGFPGDQPGRPGTSRVPPTAAPAARGLPRVVELSGALHGVKVDGGNGADAAVFVVRFPVNGIPDIPAVVVHDEIEEVPS